MMVQSIMPTAKFLVSDRSAGGGFQATKNSNGFDKLMKMNKPKANSSLEPKENPMNKGKASNTDITSSKPLTKPPKARDNKLPKEDKKQMPSEEVDQETLAQVQAMLQTIEEAVMRQLNLSEEELSQLMIEEGISFTDLIDEETLRQLTLISQGQTDITSFLTDEGLVDSLHNLLETVEALKEDLGMEENPEQLKEILEILSIDESLEESGNGKVFNVVPEDDKLRESKSDLDNKSNHYNEGLEVSRENISETTFNNPLSNLSESKLDGQGQGQAGNDEQKLNESENWSDFVDNLTGAFEETKISSTADMVKVVQVREIANQIIEQVKVIIKPEQTSMELQLNPENLGKVNLSVVSMDGNMTAKFLVENQLVKEAIESQMQELKDKLIEQGVKVESIEVAVESNGLWQNNQESGNQNQQNSPKGSRARISLEEALSMEEDLEDQLANVTLTSMDGDLTEDSGMQIDYTA